MPTLLRDVGVARSVCFNECDFVCAKGVAVAVDSEFDVLGSVFE